MAPTYLLGQDRKIEIEKEKLAECLTAINGLNLTMGDIYYKNAHSMTEEQRDSYKKAHTIIMIQAREIKYRLTGLQESNGSI